MRKMRRDDELIFEIDIDAKIVEIDVNANANVIKIDVDAKIVKNSELIFFSVENLIIVFKMKSYF